MDIVSTGLSYMDIVNYKQYRFQKYRNRILKRGRASGKVYGSIEVFDFNHDGKPDYAINGTQYAHGTGFRNTLYFIKILEQVFNMTKTGWTEPERKF
jgi:hypothetical protein